MKKLSLLFLVLIVFASCENINDVDVVVDEVIVEQPTVEQPIVDEVVIEKPIVDEIVVDEVVIPNVSNEQVEAYIRENISMLNPLEAILGGTWYVTSVDFGGENNVKVYSEDGHIMSIFKAKYIVDENNKISLIEITDISDFE